jgi:hypothetical protein
MREELQSGVFTSKVRVCVDAGPPGMKRSPYGVVPSKGACARSVLDARIGAHADRVVLADQSEARLKTDVHGVFDTMTADGIRPVSVSRAPSSIAEKDSRSFHRACVVAQELLVCLR